MKIAYLTNQYPKVSHTFIRREIAALEDLGWHVERLSLRGAPESLADAADQAEVDQTRVLLDEGGRGLLAAMSRMAARRPVQFARAMRAAIDVGWLSERGLPIHSIYLAEACLLTEWCEDLDVRHVHVHFGTNPTTVAMLAQELGGPSYSFTVHGPEEFDKAKLLRLDAKIDRARFVVAISEFGRSQLYRQCGHEHWSKIHIVRCGVDRSYLTQRAAPLADTNRLVCVGRLSEQKGQLLLVEAASRLARDGIDFRLVLVGDGELREEVEEQIAHGGIEHQVEITGWAPGDRVRQELEAARALVLPSFAEGLPVVIMEALAMERPVLSTYVAGIPELVVPGDCGWLVPAGSVDELVKTMKQVLTAPVDELRQMGQRGRQRVQEAHDVSKSADQLSELLSKYIRR